MTIKIFNIFLFVRENISRIMYIYIISHVKNCCCFFVYVIEKDFYDTLLDYIFIIRLEIYFKKL